APCSTARVLRNVNGSEEILSLDGLSKFKHEDGREFALDRCALQKLPSRTNDDETKRELSRKCYVVQKIASARTLLVGTFFRETMNREFSNLGIQSNEGFLICPAGGGKSVTVKLRLQDGRFADVKLILTEGPTSITPGRYVMAENRNMDDLWELGNMGVEIYGRRVGKQTADIEFYHKQKGQFTVNNVALRYHSSSMGGQRDHDHSYAKPPREGYVLRDHRGFWPTGTDAFLDVNVAFNHHFPDLSKYPMMICVVSNDSISFVYQIGEGEEREITLIRDAVNLNLLAEFLVVAMKKLLIIIPVNSASAAVAQNQFLPPLLPGYYETFDTTPEIPFMAGISMRVRRTAHGKRADLKFQLDDGTDLSLDDYVVERMRHRKDDEDSRRELVAKCYVFRRTNGGALDHADSLSLWKITRTFTSLRVYDREDFLICPDGGGKSVTIKLRLQDGRFAD
ncbi:hypothetical protein FOZ62_002154, partial [Perkinsus olseni]